MKKEFMNEKRSLPSYSNESLTRRSLFKGVTAGLVAGGLAGSPVTGLAQKAKSKKKGVRKGRINQSVVSWCFSEHWSVEETCKHAKDLGCKSIELIDSKHWPVLKKYGFLSILL